MQIFLNQISKEFLCLYQRKRQNYKKNLQDITWTSYINIAYHGTDCNILFYYSVCLQFPFSKKKIGINPSTFKKITIILITCLKV